MGNQDLEQVVETARRQYQNGEFSEALSTCEAAEASGIESADFAVIHSAALMSLKRYREAGAFLQEKLEQYPTEDRLYYNFASLTVRIGRTEEAQSIIDDAKRHGVHTGKISAAKALVMLRRFEYRKALAFLEEEITKYRNEAYLHYYLAQAYSANLFKLKAREEFQKAVSLDKSLAHPVRKRHRIMYVFWLVFLVSIIACIVLIAVFSNAISYLLPLLFLVVLRFFFFVHLSLERLPQI